MGVTCSQECCISYFQECKDHTYELAFASNTLEAYQDKKLDVTILSKYDRFYRVVCDPLPTMNVSTFVADIDFLIAKLEKENNKQSQPIVYDKEYIPYATFTQYFGKKKEWAAHIKNFNSCFMRLMQIENLFYCKKQVFQPPINNQNNSEIPNNRLQPMVIAGQTLNKDGVNAVQGVSDLSALRSSRESNLSYSNVNQNLSIDAHVMHQNNQVNFDKSSSSFIIKDQNGNLQVVQLCIDVFNLKLFAILMCLGSTREKAEILFNTIIGPEGVRLEKNNVTWRSVRMKAAFQRLIFFSEIFPKRYTHLFTNELNQVDRYIRLRKIQKIDNNNNSNV